MRNLLSRLLDLIGRTRAEPVYPMRRPVSELLDVGYKFAQGPHATTDVESTRDVA